MEMISFCPTVIVRPGMYAGNILPYIFFTIGYGRLLNKYGKDFTWKYLSPAVEKLALETEWNKMLLSYALQKEINAGNANRFGGIYFSLDIHPRQIIEELYTDLPQLRRGVYGDIMKILEAGNALTVAPAAHYFEGGILVDEHMRTTLAGLFAAGEVTGGTFGANRVSAATTEMLVQGARAGESAAEYAGTRPESLSIVSMSSEIPDRLQEEILAPLISPPREGLPAAEVLTHTQDTVSKSLTVLRREEILDAALKEIKGIEAQELPAIAPVEKTGLYNREWQTYLTLRNSLITAKSILASALERRESRGVHIREDHFYTDNKNFLHNQIIENTSLEMRIQNIEGGDPRDQKRESYPAYIERIVAELENGAAHG
jgi:succinate dehydrogenase/fumarate reductase flavoprotein subunit